MKFVGLVSGGKDSLYNILKCFAYGHELICIANLYPAHAQHELNSFMYQSAGFHLIPAISQCLNVPLIRKEIRGKSLITTMEYHLNHNNNDNNNHSDIDTDCNDEVDEVEDLYCLLLSVKQRYPEIQGVACGAIISHYQRIRLEHVCQRLKLIPLCYLWERPRMELFHEMVHYCADSGLEDSSSSSNINASDRNIHAILVKVAGAGLVPEKHLGKDLKTLTPILEKLNAKYGLDMCGEGGEYESLVLDCPLFKSRIVIVRSHILYDEEDPSVGNLIIDEYRIEPKISTGVVAESNVTEVTDSSAQEIGMSIKSTERPDCTYSAIRIEPQLHHCLVAIDGAVLSNLIFPDLSLVASKAAAIPLDSMLERQVLSMLANLTHTLSHIQISGQCYSATIRDVGFVHLYVRDMSNFELINKIYCTEFDESFPHSRCCVQVGLPDGVFVAMQVRALVGSSIIRGTVQEQKQLRSHLHIRSISEWAPLCIGPYCQATTLHRGHNLVSGQIALNPATMELMGQDQMPSSLMARLGSLRCQLLISFRNALQVLSSLESSGSRALSCIVYVAVPTFDKLSISIPKLGVELIQLCRRLLSAKNSDRLPYIMWNWYKDFLSRQTALGASRDEDLVQNFDAFYNSMVSEIENAANKLAPSWCKAWFNKSLQTSASICEVDEGKYGHDDDCGFADDSNGEEDGANSDAGSTDELVSEIPVLFIGVEALPRDAAVEIEVSSLGMPGVLPNNLFSRLRILLHGEKMQVANAHSTAESSFKHTAGDAIVGFMGCPLWKPHGRQLQERGIERCSLLEESMCAGATSVSYTWSSDKSPTSGVSLQEESPSSLLAEIQITLIRSTVCEGTLTILTPDLESLSSSEILPGIFSCLSQASMQCPLIREIQSITIYIAEDALGAHQEIHEESRSREQESNGLIALQSIAATIFKEELKRSKITRMDGNTPAIVVLPLKSYRADCLDATVDTVHLDKPTWTAAAVKFTYVNYLQLESELWIWNGRQ